MPDLSGRRHDAVRDRTEQLDDHGQLHRHRSRGGQHPHVSGRRRRRRRQRGWDGPGVDPITVASTTNGIFAHDFSSGTLDNWTSTAGSTVDGVGRERRTSQRPSQVAARPGFLSRDLGAGFPTVCLSTAINTAINAASLDPTNSVALLRLQTVTGGGIARVFATSSGSLFAKSDVSGAQKGSGVALGIGWHTLELCVTVGATGTSELDRDGVRIVNAFTTNTGSTSIGSVAIGDPARQDLHRERRRRRRRSGPRMTRC